jgi:hypothetical protein
MELRPCFRGLRGYGRRVGAGTWSDLLYGLTPPGCLETGPSAGPQSFQAPTGAAGRSAWPGQDRRGLPPSRSAVGHGQPRRAGSAVGADLQVVPLTCVVRGLAYSVPTFGADGGLHDVVADHGRS